MTLAIYPPASDLPGLGYGVHWTVDFFNQPSAVAVSGASIDLALASTPLHTFELIYNFLRDGPIGSPLAAQLPASNTYGTSEFRDMLGMFLSQQGSVGRFLFANPDDNFAVGQLIGTGNGSQQTFQIVRTLGSTAISFSYTGTEPVGYVDTVTSTPVVYGNTGSGPVVIPGSAYTISQTTPVNQTITFIGPPASGEIITMDFNYLYYCRFVGNSLTLEKMYNRVWMAQKVTIQSCRQGA